MADLPPPPFTPPPPPFTPPPPPPPPPPAPPPPTLPPVPPPAASGAGDEPERVRWWKRRAWKLPVWAWIVVGLVVLMGAAGAAGGNDEDAAEEEDNVDTSPSDEATAQSSVTEPEVSDPATEPPAAAETPPVAEAPATTPTATEPPSTPLPAPPTEPPATPAPTTTLPSIPTFGSGTQLIGTDIQPGIYITRSSSCYWERLSGLSGEFEDIITNGIVTGQAIVEVAPTDIAFGSSGCDAWTAFLPGEPVASFGDGDWAVGTQISAGVYRGDGSEGCYWERGSDFLHEFDGIITNDIGDINPTVEISASDARFTSSGCGTWSLAG